MAAAPRAYWLRSGFFTLVERFALQALGMGTVMILLRAFAQHQETYGVWVLYTVVAAFLEVARNGLIQNALVKYISGAEEDEYRRIATASLCAQHCGDPAWSMPCLLLLAPLAQRGFKSAGPDALDPHLRHCQLGHGALQRSSTSFSRPT